MVGLLPIDNRATIFLSQTPRAPMLLFEFVGELFQFDVREPEFAASFQFPPSITACPITPSLNPAFA
jgi:hypothetical protein